MVRFAPAVHHRRSIRVKGYDYSQAGSYFITACTKNRECILGTLTDGNFGLSPLGEIVARQWLDLPNRFPNVGQDAFVVMPNHVHGIIVLAASVGATLAVAQNRPGTAIDVSQNVPGASRWITQNRAGASPAPTGQCRPGLGEVIGTFKSLCVREWLHYIRENGLDAIGKFWQRNYYEHIVRDENDLNRIREYIASNPFCWESDRENPHADNRATKWHQYEEAWFLKGLSDD